MSQRKFALVTWDCERRCCSVIGKEHGTDTVVLKLHSIVVAEWNKTSLTTFLLSFYSFIERKWNCQIFIKLVYKTLFRGARGHWELKWRKNKMEFRWSIFVRNVYRNLVYLSVKNHYWNYTISFEFSMTSIKWWLEEAYYIWILKLFVQSSKIKITTRNLPNACFERIYSSSSFFSNFTGKLGV